MAAASRLAARTCAAACAGAAASLAVYALAGRVATVGAGTSLVAAASVSNVHYHLDATAPSHIDAVTLSIRPAIRGGGVAVRAGKTTYRCRLSRAGTDALCRTTSPQLGVRELTSISVIAAG